MNGNYDEQVERRVSQESRIVRLEGKVDVIEQDVKETKKLISGINTSLNTLTSEFVSAKTAFAASFKTAGIAIGFLVAIVTGAFAIHWIQIPSEQIQTAGSGTAMITKK